MVADGSPEQLQQEFHGAESVTLEIRTGVTDPIQEIAPHLRALNAVTSVTLLGHAAGVSRFEIHTEKGSDVRAEAFRLVVDHGWTLQEMHRKVTTLEEVFHKLTTQ